MGKGGNRAKRGEPGRPPHVGFQKGHRPFYTGGSVPGHAPTNVKGEAEYLVHSINDPTHPHYQYRFDQPLGIENRKKGGRWAKDRERQCLEAIQNGSDPEKLKKRFPPGMVDRLDALHRVATDDDHRDFMHAQRMISEILKRLGRNTAEGANGDGTDSMGVASIELAPGHATPPPLFTPTNGKESDPSGGSVT